MICLPIVVIILVLAAATSAALADYITLYRFPQAPPPVAIVVGPAVRFPVNPTDPIITRLSRRAPSTALTARLSRRTHVRSHVPTYSLTPAGVNYLNTATARPRLSRCLRPAIFQSTARRGLFHRPLPLSARPPLAWTLASVRRALNRLPMPVRVATVVTVTTSDVVKAAHALAHLMPASDSYQARFGLAMRIASRRVRIHGTI